MTIVIKHRPINIILYQSEMALTIAKALESRRGTRFAAADIYRTSDPGYRVPRLFTTNEIAMADIKACAAAEAARKP